MKLHWRLGLLALVFFLGVLARDFSAQQNLPLPTTFGTKTADTQTHTFSTQQTKPALLSSVLQNPTRTLSDLPSPADWIKEEQILVYKDKVIINLEQFGRDIAWATFTNTNSMDPVIDSGANAIEFVPTSEEDINVGDIISYTSPYTTGPVIHRVIDIGEDENGKYYILKGDNNPRADPGKIRFEDIQRVVLAIIY